jgi:hypothetical protein
MKKLAIIESAPAPVFDPNHPTAAWDLVEFLSNAKNYGNIIGGGVITLLGLLVVIWAVVLIAKKFFASAQSGPGESWVKIVLMLVIGGAMLTGGIALFVQIAGGGETTIRELGGGGFIVLQSLVR